MPRRLLVDLRRLFTNSFVKFVLKRIVFYAIVAFVALNLIFFIPRLVPSDPVSFLMPRQVGSITQEVMDEIRAYYRSYFGTNQPGYVQYLNFWRQILTLDLGRSWPANSRVSWPQPVAQTILTFLPFTLALLIPVLALSFFLGNWIGAKAAFTEGKFSELVYFFSVFTNRLPSFWFGMVLAFFLSVKVAFFPATGWFTVGTMPGWNLDTFIDIFRHYCLPFLSLFIVYLGGWATGMRSMIIHEMDSGYVRYSEQLGFRKSKSMSYARRNAILPQFTGINLYFNALIGETAIIEIIFGWPGIGRLMYDAVMNNNVPMILGCFLVIMVIVIFGNFLVDISYGFVDPRIRIGHG